MATLETPTHVVVRDGSTITVRLAGQDDVERLFHFLQSLSPESLYYQFHRQPTFTAARIRTLIAFEASHAITLIAESAGRIVGFATYCREDRCPHRADVAFAVDDVMQGQGIGMRLLERLASLARAHGIETFDAFVLSDNRRMLQVFRDSGLNATVSVEAGIWHVALSLTVTEQFLAQSAARSQASAAASMRVLFEPRVVAVIGANRVRGRIGSEILHNLGQFGFSGAIVPVHPDAPEIEGRRAYRRVADVPGPVDLAIVVVPARSVLAAVDDCIAKNVRAICVISAGFSECDAEGRTREALLVEKVRRAGCRLIGPNSMGLINTDPAVRLNATFSPLYPQRGTVAMLTQSGALGLAILDYARRLDIGISSFVSVGNKADVSGNDLMQYWAADPYTSVILLYLESFGSPQAFVDVARRVGRAKPIVAVKAGRSSAGSRAAASHTGALASSDVVVDALFRQAGVIRTERLEEMFDVATLLSHQPLPRGRRVAILTNAGGPGILAADACGANGLELPSLGEATRAELQSFLPAAASLHNPIDMLASASPDDFRRALVAILRDDAVDSVITIFIPPLATKLQAFVEAISDAAQDQNDKPVLAVLMRAEAAPPGLSPIPAYAFPESAALALARVAAYAAWRSRPVVAASALDRFDRNAIRGVIEASRAGEAEWLSPQDAHALLTAAGIAIPESAVVTSGDDAVRAATRMGYPVALKAVGRTLVHRTERKAVTLNLQDAAAVRAAYQDFQTRLGAEMTGVLVQRMIPPGAEMLVGAIQDPLFGPMIGCGTGGVMVEVFADTAFRLHPLTASDAGDMIDELRGARLLRGYRGAPRVDEAALRDVLLRVSALIGAAPEIRELDLNPVIVLPSGACVADVRVRLGSATG